MIETREVIFIGLPGPTHNYGGLSADNVASSKNRGQVSQPQAAAKQVLGLMRQLLALDIPVAILPPQQRPYLPLLHQEFGGDSRDVILQAAEENPALLEQASSSSAMWTANSATVAPCADSEDGHLHITTANLHTNLHRRIEAEDTHRVLTQIFKSVPDCTLHSPLPPDYPDEGAANHTRLCPSHSREGLHVFVYGKDGGTDDPPSARHSRAASEKIARSHRLPAEHALFIKQNPDVIRHGVFHNDVIAVGNENVLLVHEAAYAGGVDDISRIENAYLAQHPDSRLHVLMIRQDRLTVEEAVHTYLFNSQIISKPDGGMTIIAPEEVKALYGGKAAGVLADIREDAANPINEIRTIDLRQSMQNGGGPACLRLRVPMTVPQLDALKTHSGVMIDDALLARLERVIEAHYPVQLPPRDIKDPALYDACHSFLTALGPLLKLRLV